MVFKSRDIRYDEFGERKPVMPTSIQTPSKSKYQPSKVEADYKKVGIHIFMNKNILLFSIRLISRQETDLPIITLTRFQKIKYQRLITLKV